jgi:hypothetical protein
MNSVTVKASKRVVTCFSRATATKMAALIQTGPPWRSRNQRVKRYRLNQKNKKKKTMEMKIVMSKKREKMKILKMNWTKKKKKRKKRK